MIRTDAASGFRAGRMHRNAIKYPAHLVRGSSKKYDEYETGEATGVEPQAARE